MWREVLKGKNVTRGKSNDGLRIGGTGKLAESLQQRDEVFHAAIIGTHQNQRPVCRSLQQNQQQGFGRRR